MEENRIIPTTDELIKKPKKRKYIIFLVVAVIVIAIIGIGVLCYLKSDAYLRIVAEKALQNGDYQKAFEIIYALDSEDDRLPFHGKYVNISIGDQRTLEFKNGLYISRLSATDDNVFDGKCSVTGYQKAVLTDAEDYTTDEYGAYQNYIYEREEDFVYEGEVDITQGYFNGTISEKITIKLPSSGIGFDHLQTYIFQDDGTYTYVSEQSNIGSDNPYATHRKSGTYKIEGDLLVLRENEDNAKEISLLVIDKLVYRVVYERDYSGEMNK